MCTTLILLRTANQMPVTYMISWSVTMLLPRIFIQRSVQMILSNQALIVHWVLPVRQVTIRCVILLAIRIATSSRLALKQQMTLWIFMLITFMYWVLTKLDSPSQPMTVLILKIYTSTAGIQALFIPDQKCTGPLLLFLFQYPIVDAS